LKICIYDSLFPLAFLFFVIGNQLSTSVYTLLYNSENLNKWLRLFQKETGKILSPILYFKNPKPTILITDTPSKSEITTTSNTAKMASPSAAKPIPAPRIVYAATSLQTGLSHLSSTQTTPTPTFHPFGPGGSGFAILHTVESVPAALDKVVQVPVCLFFSLP